MPDCVSRTSIFYQGHFGRFPIGQSPTWFVALARQMMWVGPSRASRPERTPLPSDSFLISRKVLSPSFRACRLLNPYPPTSKNGGQAREKGRPRLLAWSDTEGGGLHSGDRRWTGSFSPSHPAVPSAVLHFHRASPRTSIVGRPVVTGRNRTAGLEPPPFQNPWPLSPQEDRTPTGGAPEKRSEGSPHQEDPPFRRVGHNNR